ncbi:MAG: ArnT family glycosyltransferase [Planctomycetota bacterium]|jgi:4-amino-4-deoxy-L-arabinose transferase-like glycosyltransferase
MQETPAAVDARGTPEGAEADAPGHPCCRVAAWCRSRPVTATTSVLVALFAVRLAGGALTISRGSFLCTDGEDYYELAANVAAGRGYVVDRVRWFEPPRPLPAPDFCRPPLLPLTLAVFYSFLPDSLWLATAFIAAIGAAGACVCALLARKLWGEASFAPALALAGAWPVFVFFSAFLATEAPMILALAGVMLAMVSLARDAEAPRGRLAWRSALTGVLLGLSALVRPTMLVGFGLVPLWAWMALRATRARRVLVAGIVLAAACATVAPWTARNYATSGDLIPVTSFGGYTFWLGNNETNLRAYSSPSYAEFLREQEHLVDCESGALVREMVSEGDASPKDEERFWMSRGLEFVREKPLGFAYLVSVRLGHFFRPWLNPAAYGWDVAALSLAGWSALYAAGAAGFARLWRRERAAALAVAAVIVTGAVAHAITHVTIRYRVPFLDTAAIVLAAPVLVDWARAAWVRVTTKRAATEAQQAADAPATAGETEANP